MKYRIDIQKDGAWRAGSVTFHDQTPLAALEDIAGQFHGILHRPVRLVRVYEVRSAYVEEVRVFDGLIEAEEMPA
jgi:hypothetical protein